MSEILPQEHVLYMYTVSIGGPVSTLLEFYSIFSYSIHR